MNWHATTAMIMLTLVSWTATEERTGLEAGAKAEAVARSERVAAIFILM